MHVLMDNTDIAWLVLSRCGQDLYWVIAGTYILEGMTWYMSAIVNSVKNTGGAFLPPRFLFIYASTDTELWTLALYFAMPSKLVWVRWAANDPYAIKKESRLRL